MVRHQVVVVEHSYPEYCRVDTHAQEEDSDEAHYLVERKKTELRVPAGIFDLTTLANTLTSMQM